MPATSVTGPTPQRDSRGYGDHRAPQPPGLRGLANDRVNCNRQNAAEDHADDQTLALVAQPGAQSLVGHAVLMLSEEAFVGAPGQREKRADRNILGGIDRRPQPAPASPTFRCRPHAQGPLLREQKPGDRDRDDGIPQRQPVSAFEIRIRFRLRCRRQRCHICLCGLFGTEVRCRDRGAGASLFSDSRMSCKRQEKCCEQDDCTIAHDVFQEVATSMLYPSRSHIAVL